MQEREKLQRVTGKAFDPVRHSVDVCVIARKLDL